MIGTMKRIVPRAMHEGMETRRDALAKSIVGNLEGCEWDGARHEGSAPQTMRPGPGEPMPLIKGHP